LLRNPAIQDDCRLARRTLARSDAWRARWRCRCRHQLLSSATPGEHHVDRAATATGTDKPVAPIENARRIAISSGEVRGIGLHLMAPILAPNDEADMGGGCVAERHQRTWRRCLSPLSARCAVSVWLSPAVAHIASAGAVTVRALAPA